MSNPLLSMTGLPPFSRIRPEHVLPALQQAIDDNRKQVEALLAANDTYSWDNLVQPLEDMDDELSRLWSPVSHMNSVVNSDELREAYNACLPLLSDYSTEMGQNEALFQAFRQIRDGAEYARLDPAQQKVIDNALRDFRLAGVDLPADKKARYKAIQQELSGLTSKFSDNLLDATNGWHKQVTDEAALAGLPESSVGLAKQAAEERELSLRGAK